jgi:chloride channel protein, CIC family
VVDLPPGAVNNGDMLFPEGIEEPQAGPFFRIVALTVTAILVGAASSIAAIGFVELVGWLNNVLLVSPRARVQFEEYVWLVPAATVLVPAAGGLIVGVLVYNLASIRRPPGPPGVIRAVQLRSGLPDMRSGGTTILASVISLGCGASVGQYGPMVYLGAMFGNLAAKLRLRVANLPPIAIACGVAAAISTAFNAPIAGLVFAHEVVLRHYATQAFAPTTVAASIGYIIANVIFDRPPLFLVSFGGVRFGYEFWLFGLLGLCCAIMAILFMRLLLSIPGHAAKTRIPRTMRPATAGLCLGIVGLWLPDILGMGKETLRFATIEGAFTFAELPLLILAKILLTALCIGLGFAGGVFSPALLIGVLLGAWFWMLIDTVLGIPTSGIAVYALCGMMALTSPIIGAPLTAILIVFELTRNYDITIASMVGVVFANLIAHHFFGRSLYDVQLHRWGVDLSTGRDKAKLQAAEVPAFRVEDLVTAHPDDPAGDVARQLDRSDWTTAFVLDNRGRLRGVFSSTAKDGPVGEHMDAPELIFNETTNIIDAMRGMRDFPGDAAPIVDQGSGRFLGAVTEAAVMKAYFKISQSLRREENAAL